MFVNDQKPEKSFRDPEGKLEVHSIWPTIQGEGPFAGCPAVFIRLSGCSLQCNFCDTDYTSSRVVRTPEEILEIVQQTCEGKISLVVLTGGEPFRQNLTPLTSLLMRHDFFVQVETNGVHPPSVGLNPKVMIVCSPKTSYIDEEMGGRVDFWKYVLQDGFIEEDGLPSVILGSMRPARPSRNLDDEYYVYVQPLDQQDAGLNERNLKATLASSMEHGYRLCLQLHKIVGLD